MNDVTDSVSNKDSRAFSPAPLLVPGGQGAPCKPDATHYPPALPPGHSGHHPGSAAWAAENSFPPEAQDCPPPPRPQDGGGGGVLNDAAPGAKLGSSFSHTLGCRRHGAACRPTAMSARPQENFP